MTITLLPHQKEAITKMHNGCVLWGGVGTGKTITSLAYAMEREPGRKVVVITTAKKRDTLDWIKEAGMMAFPVDDLVVESWNKITAFVDYEDHLFIFDEQRLVGKGRWVKSFYKIAKNNKWILLSATPGDTWADYAPLFIANGWYKNITEFTRTHAIYSRYTTYPKIERWVNEGRLQKYRKQILVEMPMVRHTTRHMHYVNCDYDHELLDIVRKRRWNVYEDKPLKNAAELFGVMRKVVSSDPDRVTKLEELAETHPRLIVFYNFDYELEILREMCNRISHVQSDAPFECGDDCPSCSKKENFSWAEYNGHKHQEVPNSERWIYLVQYLSASESWNCTETDTMVFWSLTYSWKQFWQAQGRIDRMNTPFSDLHYYVLMTGSQAEVPVIKSLEKKEDFQPR